jgi:hypothetical protein
MAKFQSKSLVVDACIAGTMGERNDNGKLCRDFMDTFLSDTNHKFVISDDIKREWDVHGKHPYTKTWLTSMRARRRIFRIEENCEDKSLREQICALPSIPDHIQSMSKDVILIEAAIKSDRTIISIDKKARRLFAGACKRIRYIHDIAWINPCIPEDEAVCWLKNGANSTEYIRLYNYNDPIIIQS